MDLRSPALDGIGGWGRDLGTRASVLEVAGSSPPDPNSEGAASRREIASRAQAHLSMCIF